MAKTVAEIRALDAVTFGHVLVIDGISTMFTDRPELVGTGASSWIGQTYGHWTVLGGLELPSSFENEIDVRSGKFEHSSARVRILEDDDGTIVSLFATKGKEKTEIAGLRSSVATATTSVPVGGGSPLSVQGKHIGTEYIGSGSDGFTAGDRRCFHCFPLAIPHIGSTDVGTGLPLDHIWRGHTGDPPITFSDDPTEFAGRWFALYRIYKDPDLNAGTYADWPNWQDQFAGGGLVYFGTLRDQGTISQATRGRKWTLELLGPRSMLEKQLNKSAPEPDDWYTVSSPLVFRTDEGKDGGRTDALAVSFYSQQVYGTAKTTFKGQAWHASHVLSATDPVELAGEIDAAIEEAEDDTTTNLTGDTYFQDPASSGAPHEFRFERGEARVRSADYSAIGSASTRITGVDVILHRSVWQHLGWDFHIYPDKTTGELVTGGQDDRKENDPLYVSLSPPITGNFFQFGNDTEIVEAPGDNYIMANFSTVPVQTTSHAGREPWTYDNEGDWRKYFPANPLTTRLDGDGGQVVDLTGDPIYLESQKGRPPSWATVGGGTSDSTRYFVFRGPVLREGQEEPEEEFQVAKCSWKDNLGMIATSNQSPQLYIERWEDPRLWGFDNPPLTRDWVTGPGEIQCAPLGSFDYVPASHQVAYDGPLDHAWVVLLRTLLSTGTSGTWGSFEELLTTAEDNPPSDGVNDNGVTGAHRFLRANDLEIADMGLGIPQQLVDSPSTFQGVFEKGLWLDRLKLGYLGPVQADDVLTSLLQPVGACWTLNRSSGIPQFSVFRPFETPSPADVDIEITEADLYGDTADPTTCIPDQDLRWAQPIDSFKTGYHWNPVDRGFGHTWEVGARDSGARYRGGKVEYSFDGAGLIHHSLASKVNGGDWPQSYATIWATEAAKWWAGRHFVVRGLPVRRALAWQIEPGTKVLLTNPWLLLPDGTVGTTDAVGIVIRAREFTASGHKELDILIDANSLNFQDLRVFAPIARITDYNSGTKELTCEADYWGRGSGSDVEFFEQPSWSTDPSGNAKIQIWYYNRRVWTTGPTGIVSSVNTTTHKITLTATLTGTWYDDKVAFVTMNDYDTSGQPAWVENLFGWTTNPNHQLGTGPTNGWPFII